MKKTFFSLVTLLTTLFLATNTYAQTQIQLPLMVPESAVITAPSASAVGSGGSCTAGTHVFAVSFVTGAGDETGIGNGVQVTCVASDSVSLSVIPIGSNNVTARNIYATKAGTTSPFYLVSSLTVADNTTTTYTFTLADTSLGAALTVHATPAQNTLWSLWSNGSFMPTADNKYVIGGTSNRLTNVYTVKLNAGLTLPSGTDTLVGKATTDTLTNKTLSADTFTGNINSDYKVLAASITYSAIPAAATITGFSWTVVAGGTYIFEMNLPTTMTTVGGLTVNFKLTTATLTSIQYQTYASTAADATTAVSTQGTTTTDATKVFDSKTAAYTYLRVVGSFVVNAGGTFAWQATQNTSGTSGDVTILLLGGYAKLIRVL